MRQSGHFTDGTLTPETLVALLHERFAQIDFAQAAGEVRPFVHDPRELDLWSEEFFNELASRLAAD